MKEDEADNAEAVRMKPQKPEEGGGDTLTGKRQTPKSATAPANNKLIPYPQTRNCKNNTLPRKIPLIFDYFRNCRDILKSEQENKEENSEVNEYA